MGVPGFYRWAVKRIPGIRAQASSTAHECDNLYLDFNGVVHGCIEDWAGEDDDVLFGFIEARLAMLLQVVHPAVLLYIALDGVAPRAKMNQQRSRRFRAARDAAAAAMTIEGAGLGSFDRNAVTPGTSFMIRLTRFLESWAERAAADMLRGAVVVVSGHLDPGEGEHKIMDIIRCYPERTHCLLSNDADLVFLGLVSPANQVVLLREKPKRGGGSASARQSPPNAKMDQAASVEPAADPVAEEAEVKEVAVVDQSPAASCHKEFELLSIVAIRDWLAEQFPGHEVQRLAADFVAMCCLVGNDFLPHLQAVDTYDGGIDRLICAYRDTVLAQGYLVDANQSLVLPMWTGMLEQIATLEIETLLASSGLGLGERRRQQRGPRPPTEEWDGLSVIVSRAPQRAKARDIISAMSKQNCVAVTALPVRGRGPRAPPVWLVRFDQPSGAVSVPSSQPPHLGLAAPDHLGQARLLRAGRSSCGALPGCAVSRCARCSHGGLDGVLAGQRKPCQGPIPSAPRLDAGRPLCASEGFP